MQAWRVGACQRTPTPAPPPAPLHELNTDQSIFEAVGSPSGIGFIFSILPIFILSLEKLSSVPTAAGMTAIQIMHPALTPCFGTRPWQILPGPPRSEKKAAQASVSPGLRCRDRMRTAEKASAWKLR
jgi:hypothetical protein